MPRSSSLKGKKNEQTKKSRENILKNKQNVEVVYLKYFLSNFLHTKKNLIYQSLTPTQLRR